MSNPPPSPLSPPQNQSRPRNPQSHPPLLKFPPPIRKPTHSSRAAYWRHRHKQLSAQAPVARTALFRGLVVYFTGVRSGQRALEKLVWTHGGRVAKLWLRRDVTHVVADNLAAAKMEKEIKARPSERTLVVTPQWLTECVTRGIVVRTDKFRVIKTPPGLCDLTNFFAKEAKSTAKSSPKT